MIVIPKQDLPGSRSLIAVAIAVMLLVGWASPASAEAQPGTDGAADV